MDLLARKCKGHISHERACNQPGCPITHDLTQEEIAQLVGASREAVNETLTDFARRCWIRLEGKSVLISDSERP